MFFSTIEFDELKEYKDKVMYVSGFSVVVVLAVFFAYAYHSPESVNWVWASGLFAYPVLLRISVNPIGRFGFIRSLFLLLFRPCQFYRK